MAVLTDSHTPENHHATGMSDGFGYGLDFF